MRLVNLLLREADTKLTTLSMPGHQEPDPEIYVVTRIPWRDAAGNDEVLPQLPRLLAILDTLRGNRGVPTEVFLDSTEGLAVYLPTEVHISDIPEKPRDAVKCLKSAMKDTKEHFFSTMYDVERYFWREARKRGYNRDTVERIARNERGFDSSAQRSTFHQMLRDYFSTRFTIHTAEWCLRVEV
jgi:hypothetical protein